MDNLFKESSQKILIYMSTETQIDPFSKEVENVELNSLPIDAIVTDVVGSRMSYKTMGIIQEDSKELICEKKHRKLIELSYKITVDSIDYQGYKINGIMSIRNLDSNYIKLYITRNK